MRENPENSEITRLRDELARVKAENEVLYKRLRVNEHQRDKALAVLKEIRDAAAGVFPSAPLDHARIIPPEHARLFRAIASEPTQSSVRLCNEGIDQFVYCTLPHGHPGDCKR